MPKSSKTSVLIADPHLLIREGVKAVLSTDAHFEVVAEVMKGEDLCSAVRALKPHIVIMDFSSPGCFTIEDIPAVYDLSPASRVLVLTNNKNKNDILKALEYGVDNYILKKCGKDELLAAIYATVKKERYMCRHAVDAIVEKHMHPNESYDGISLSPREIEIIQLISEGNTNNSIAKLLYLSIHTVSTHRKNILKKFGLKKSSELVMHAIRAGIITPSES